MKKCTKCGEFKSLNEFYKEKLRKDGLRNDCKICNNKAKKDYFKTKGGLISMIYSHQRSHSISKGRVLPNYSNQELRNWLFGQEKFHEMYDNWVKSGYLKDLKPSIDRKNNNKPYTIDNIQLMTWDENNKKGYNDMRRGDILITSNPQKPVLQFDKQGNFIKEYPSQSQASRKNKISQTNISRVCLGKRKTAGGFIWKFKNL
jgi:hypothetical protein